MPADLLAPAPVLPAPRREQESAHDLVAVRAWARSVGYPVDETAGVPLAVLRTYRQVHGR